MTSKASTAGGLFILFAFIFMIFVATYDYFTTPQFKVLPVIFTIFFFMFVFLMTYGEYLGVVVSALAKKTFITRGGLVGVYEAHKDSDSGMVTYYFSTYTRYLQYCGVQEFSEMSAFTRFLTFLTPTRVYAITDKREMFEEISTSASDTPEGTIFYHGTLRGVSIITFEQSLRMKLDRANTLISELWTHLLKAQSAAEAAAQGQNQKLVEVSTQVSTVLENITKYQKEPQQVVVQQEGRQ